MAVEVIDDIALERLGESGPTLIFLHGFSCDRSDWRAQVEALAGRYRVVIVDLPGHGQSPVPISSTMESIAQTLGEIIAGWDDNGVILIGHSLGCRIALEMYRQTPAHIRALILLDNGEIGHADPARTVALFDEQIRSLGVVDLLAAGFAGMFVRDSDPRLRQRVFDRVSQMDMTFGESLLRDAVRWGAYDAPHILCSVRVPVLLLQSTARDENNQWLALKPGMTTPWTELVTRSASDVTLRIIPGVGHFLQIEASEAVNAEIALFVERVVGGVHVRTAC